MSTSSSGPRSCRGESFQQLVQALKHQQAFALLCLRRGEYKHCSESLGLWVCPKCTSGACCSCLGCCFCSATLGDVMLITLKKGRSLFSASEGEDQQRQPAMTVISWEAGLSLALCPVQLSSSARLCPTWDAQGQRKQCLPGLVVALFISTLVPFTPHPINAVLLKSKSSLQPQGACQCAAREDLAECRVETSLPSEPGRLHYPLTRASSSSAASLLSPANLCPMAAAGIDTSWK